MPPTWTHNGLMQTIRFGAGRVVDLGDAIEQLHGSRALLLGPPQLAEHEVMETVRSVAPQIVGTFDAAVPHVPVPTVEEAVGMARELDADTVISLGGGSSADLGKAVSHFAPGTAAVTDDVDREVVLRHLAVPTTYSGAELTPFFGMLDPSLQRKRGVQRLELAPGAVLYDPELTLSLPADVSAQTGMNALAHCVEVAYSPDRTPEAEAIALAGIAKIAAALPAVVESPSDLSAREEMLAGSYLAGRALQNGRMGAHHGIAQLVGARSGIPHGLANAVLLPYVMRFNADTVAGEMDAIGVALGDRSDPAGAVERLLDRIGLPARLSETGVAIDDLELVAATAKANRNVAANPKPVSEEDILAILREAW
jgi:maleylacetate reductase